MSSPASLLALFGEVPWRAVPVMPVEIMLLPRWFPFHIDKISYWSRTVLVPLLVLMALRPRARNPRGVTIAELFVEPPETRARLDRAVDRLAGRPCLCAARPAAAPRRADVPGRPAAARDRKGGRLRHRAAQRRGRARRHLPGDGERRDDVRLPRLPAGSSRTSSRPRRRSASCSSSTASGPTASPACRRCGTPRWPAMR